MREVPPPALSRPEAIVVNFDHIPEAGESPRTGSVGIDNSHDAQVHQVDQEGNCADIATESLSAGRPSTNPVDIFNSIQTTKDAATRVTTLTSMEDYEAQMLEDFNTRSPDNHSTRLFYTPIRISFAETILKGSSKAYSRPVRLCEFEVDEFEAPLLPDQPYYTVICFMLDHEAANIKFLNISGQIVKLGPPPETGKVSFVRVLLRYPITPEFSSFTAFRGNPKTGSFSICYLEMNKDPPGDHLYDCISPQLPSPRRAFAIQHNTSDDADSQQVPAKILKAAISVSGSHAATISTIGKMDFIDLWELRLPEAISRVSYPYPRTPSNAYIAFDLDIRAQDCIGLSLSWDGSQIAVHHTRLSDSEGIFVFEYHGIIHQTQQRDRVISPFLHPSSRLSRCSQFKSFKGEAKFTNLSTSQWDDKSDRFVTCDGEGFSVYKTAGEWEMLYHIPQLRHAVSLYIFGDWGLPEIVGNIMALEISSYQLLIWDLDTGTKRLHIGTQHPIKNRFLSSDGRTLAVVTEENVLLYSTVTGDLLHRFGGSSYDWYGFIEGDRGIYGSYFQERKRIFFITDTRRTSRMERFIAPPLNWDHVVQDIKVGEKWDGTNTKSTVVLSFKGFILEAYYLEDTLAGTEDESQCASSSGSDLVEIPEITFGKEVAYSGGTFTIQETVHGSPRKILMDIRFKDGKSRKYWWIVTRCYFWKASSQFMMVQEFTQSPRFVSWRLPQSSQDELEILFYWIQKRDEVTKLSIHPNGDYPVLSTAEGDFQLYPGGPCTLADPRSLQKGLFFFILLQKFQCKRAMDAEIKYLCSFVNQYPVQGDHSESLLSNLIKIRNDFDSDRAELLLKKLLQANSWIPLRAYSRGANPVGAILEETKTDSSAYETGRLLINYSLDKAKEHNDLTYILYLLECLDDLTVRYPDLALRITRRFSYIRCQDREFIINNHTIAHPPTFGRLWGSKVSKIHECRNPVLQFLLNTQPDDPLTKNFTEEVFVAPVNILWSFVPNTRSPCKEFPLDDSNLRTTWIQSLYHIILFNMNPFSHVYIRPRFYTLEILDNPAIDAMVQYKWNTFAYAVWVVRFAGQCLYALLVVSAALLQVYHREKGPLLGLFSAIVVLSCVFLWLEFLQWRESWYLAQPEAGGKEDMEKPSSYSEKISRWITGIRSSITGKSQKAQNMHPLEMLGSQSQYFRSPYNTLDLITYTYPLVTSIHQIVNTINGNTAAITADFSFSVIFVFLNLLTELRVSGTMCKYITVLFGIFNEIKVFSLVLATSIVFFTIAIIHIIHGGVGVPVNIDDSAFSDNSTYPDRSGFPYNFLGAISTVFLIMGGRFDPLNSDLFVEGEGATRSAYKNGPLLVMVMVYFTFSSILMLNVLIALINNAFIKADDRWKQAWLENRLRYVEIAENMSYHIPGFRETFNWFPKLIYYTATPYHVKHYKQRVARADEEIILEDDPVEQSSESTATDDISRPIEHPPVMTNTKELERSITEQKQELQQDNMRLDRRIIEANKEISEVKVELVQVKETVAETKRDVSEMKEGIVRIQGDIQAILEALRGAQRH